MLTGNDWQLCVDEFVRELRKKHPARIEIPKETLYHYTTIQGLKGIIEDKELWLTDVRFLNDPDEINAGMSVVDKGLGAAIESFSSDKPEREFLSQLKEIWKGFGFPNHHTFVTSLTEAGDDLSQWRLYGDGGKGCALGFDLSTSESVDSVRPSVMILRCFYSEDEFFSTVLEFGREFAKGAVKYAKHYGGFASTVDNACRDLLVGGGSYFVEQMLGLATRYKSKGFEPENEWRFVYICPANTAGTGLKFRTRGERLIPYKSFSIRNEEGAENSITLVEVLVGPSGDYEERKTVSNMLLVEHGFSVSSAFSRHKYRAD